MLKFKEPIWRWGPIPGRLISVSCWHTMCELYPGKLHKYIWPANYCIFHRQRMLFVNEVEALENVGKQVFQEVILTAEKKKISASWDKHLSNLLSFCGTINQPALRKFTPEALQARWHRFDELLDLFWEPAILPELGAYGGEPILKEALERENLGEVEMTEALSILSAPTKFSFYQEEEIDLIKLIAHYHSVDFKKLLQAHQQKYFWLENSYFRTKVLSEDYFLQKVQAKIKANVNPTKALKEMRDHLALAKKEKERSLKELKNKTEIRKISDALSDCIEWQDQRKKYIFQYLHYFDLFINEFARRAKVSPRLYDFAWPEEVSASPSKKLAMLLKERATRPYVIRFINNGHKDIYGPEAKKIWQEFWEAKEEGKQEYLQGTVVYAGDKEKVVGRVYVIKKAMDIKNFPEGKILVASMTAPEYILAIRKAKAIITDEGGLTCHAAIVSRELKKPCIVGTKIATRRLKNNDLVEVDVSKGIVRKLNY